VPASRRTRRKLERKRAKRPARSNRIALGTRIAWMGGGAVLVLVGVALLIHETTSNAARLGRLAGILILIGLVCAAVGIVGRT
jgi:formate hydrogenlyase subunit 3/multisubunit Na+/H+ antiporter MnhD subunit